jgi:hypothetical protein
MTLAPNADEPAAAQQPMSAYDITVYLNVAADGLFFLFGLAPTHPVATDPDLRLTITAADPAAAAERAFTIGNRMDADDRGHRWPADVRSVSVGDLLKVAHPTGMTFYAVASVGLDEVPEPTNPRVPLAGSPATSRTQEERQP